MRRVSKEPETDKSTIEETLQSIDGTLKRIEELLSKENRIEIFAEEITNRLADSLGALPARAQFLTAAFQSFILLLPTIHPLEV